ncbi:MAG: hypothetical protein C0467_06340 [Planctomycetaceae bacterium]|nr:hypothetical protein [Planctomycetaceae bacterium]
MSAEPIFTVRRLGWHQAPHGDRYTRRLPTAVAVAQFDNFDAAEYHRRTLESEARAGENPFRFGGASLFFQSSLDTMRLHDWLLDMGIDPPVEQLRHSDWREWWDAFAHTWNEEQLHHAWHGLDKVRHFDVIEEPDAVPCRVVMEIGFVEADYHHRNAEREGGRLEGLFRSQRGAVAACAHLNEERREGTFDWWRFRYRQRLGYVGYDVPTAGNETVFFEVLDVPGELPVHAAVGFVVQRRAFDPHGYVCHDQHGRDTRSRVPVRLFADRDSAEAHRDELIAGAREVMSPFQAFPPEMAGLSEVQFGEAVEAIRPPLPWPTGFSSTQWREWWDLCQDEITPEQRAAAWDLFANHPLFEVLPMTVRED